MWRDTKTKLGQRSFSTSGAIVVQPHVLNELSILELSRDRVCLDNPKSIGVGSLLQALHDFLE